ncbi:MAG: hypothetical protein PHQ28_00835 [Mycobacterium sp.]|nr:hypothetical protein [Mycobacterium sp.]
MSAGTVMEQRAERVAAAVANRLGGHNGPNKPRVYTGAHEGSAAPFIVSWEEGPFQWPYQYDLLHALSEEIDVYLEPVSHFVVAVYPR